jgi:hypothetical protein
MTCHECDAHLDALLDGELSPTERPLVEAHLSSCPACRALLQDLRDLQAAARAAPRVVPPPADAWAVVAAHRPSGLQRRVTLPAWALAAAAALLVVAGGAGAAWLSRPPTPRPVAPVRAAQPPDLAELEREYRTAAAELSQALEAQGTRLPPSARTALERSLAVVDAAIAEAHTAALAAPDRTAPLLLAAHQRKLELLQQANRLLVPG